MEVIIFLSLLVIFIVLITFKNGVYTRITVLEKEIRRLREQLPSQQLKEEKPVQPVVPKPVAPPVPSVIQQPQPQPAPVVPVQPVQVNLPPRPQPVVQPPRPGFFERHPDLEKFIGENLISKIGIAILVLGIGFFVKYAIDNDWIGPVGRVAIGLLCGVILVTVAHFLRNTYKAFSSVLIGGGLAVFYFTISLAFHEYHLFSQTVSFIIMMVITCFAVILSILYDRQELAIIALLGGFIAPFLVSTGNGNYKVLFTYLIILNTGLLLIALRKAWRLLNLLAFIFTSILFGSWLFLLNGRDPAIMFTNGFVFATIFYLLFFVINIVHNIKEKKKFIASDFGILLANTCLYFGAGLYCLHYMGAAEYKGIFCMSMGIFNLATTYFLFRKSRVDTNILYLLIGITLTFVSLTAPVQLHGNYITLFWASETVLLYWLFQKSRLSIIRVASLVVWVAMLVSLLIDMSDIYGFGTKRLPVIFNGGFLTILFSAVSSYLLFILRKKDSVDEDRRTWWLPDRQVFRIAGIILLYCAGFLEIGHQFKQNYPSANIASLYLILYTLVFILALLNVSSRVSFLQHNRPVISGLYSLAILIYLFQIGYSFSVQKYLLAARGLSMHFIAHWLTACVAGILIIQAIKFYRANRTERNQWLTWTACTLILIYLTAEIHLLVNSIFYSGTSSLIAIQKVFIKAGWPILWGLLSFAFMWTGMRWKFRMLRIISLTLFTITLVKLFAYDIVNIPAGGKIAAFFSLGVLLLIVSFMYQRLKKIIIDEEIIAK